MNYQINNSQNSAIKNYIQYLIDKELTELKKQSEEEWGLGELYEISVVDSINSIEVVSLKKNTIFFVHINLHLTKEVDDYDYEFILEHIEYKVSENFMSVNFVVEEVIVD